MRLFALALAYVACLAAATVVAANANSNTSANALNDDVTAPYLAARQAASNTSSSASSSSPTSSSNGGTLNITQSASEDPPSGCSMSNNLSPGQSASWTETTASSCCVASSSSTCYFRMQSAVSSTDRCKIPNCDDLASGDEARMVGFKPLSSNTGSGAQNNTFNITPVNAAGRAVVVGDTMRAVYGGSWAGLAIIAVLSWAGTLLV